MLFNSRPSDDPAEARFSRPSDYPTEAALGQYILDAAGVKLLSGHSLTCPVPGYFRLCFTAFDKEKVKEAVSRMGACLNPLRA